MKKYIFILIILLLSSSLKSNTHPKREVRAAWITTAYRLDWPQTLSISPETRKKQQKELIQLLDILKAANFNTVIFQVRGRGDANYRSKWEPSSMSLTGKTNIDPGYDALQFAIEESHKRGMECHAWLVAIPSGSIKTHQQLGKASPIHKEPKTFIKFKGGWYINPASPTAKDYLGRLVEDITSNYDVDGIHFDYLRYPDGAQKSFPDQKEFKKLGNGRTLDQWRRDNITEILSHSYHLVKSIKPWVKVSSSPIGKHSDTNRYSARGWNAYETVYQDVFKWLELGIQDQVYPMMYFRGNNYYPFALDWAQQSNGRQIISGLGIYFLDPREGNWTSEEIQRQLYFVRQNNLAGHAFFRAEFLVNDTQGYIHL
nr:family 10 glycosylhydrolase [Bacteroides propionicifaciens]